MDTEQKQPEVSAQEQALLDHLAGKEVVVEYVYSDGKINTIHAMLLDPDSSEADAWDDSAFTNGPPLVEIRMRWDPAKAKEIRDLPDPGEGE